MTHLTEALALIRDSGSAYPVVLTPEQAAAVYAELSPHMPKPIEVLEAGTRIELSQGSSKGRQGVISGIASVLYDVTFLDDKYGGHGTYYNDYVKRSGEATEKVAPAQFTPPLPAVPKPGDRVMILTGGWRNEFGLITSTIDQIAHVRMDQHNGTYAYNVGDLAVVPKARAFGMHDRVVIITDKAHGAYRGLKGKIVRINPSKTSPTDPAYCLVDLNQRGRAWFWATELKMDKN